MSIPRGTLTSRVLPIEEWPRLEQEQTEFASCWRVLPEGSHVIVVEDAGRIIATWGLVFYPHLECAWVHPDYRKKGRVARRLLSAMGTLMRHFRTPKAITTALTPDIERLVGALGGVELPGKHFVIQRERL